MRVSQSLCLGVFGLPLIHALAIPVAAPDAEAKAAAAKPFKSRSGYEAKDNQEQQGYMSDDLDLYEFYDPSEYGTYKAKREAEADTFDDYETYDPNNPYRYDDYKKKIKRQADTQNPDKVTFDVGKAKEEFANYNDYGHEAQDDFTSYNDPTDNTDVPPGDKFDYNPYDFTEYQSYDDKSKREADANAQDDNNNYQYYPTIPVNGPQDSDNPDVRDDGYQYYPKIPTNLPNSQPGSDEDYDSYNFYDLTQYEPGL